MAGALDAFNRNRQASLQDTQGLFDQQAQRQAGGMLAGGDYTGAAGALYSGGLLSQGAGVQAMGERQEDRAADRQQQQAKISDAEQAERLKFLAHGATVLLSIPQEQRANAYNQSIAPALKAMGADDATIQQGGTSLDDASLQTFSGQVGKALEQFTLTPGSKRFDESGKLIAEAPLGPKYESLSPGETLVEVSAGGSPGAGAGSGAAPRSERNNNPGNIEDGQFAKSLPGYKGSDGRFAIFETPEAGAGAQVALLGSYGKRGINTVEGIINRWAPPSDNNPTPAYVDYVAKRVGVDAKTPLNMSDPATLQRVAGAIKEFEGGGQSASNGGGPRVVAQGAPKPDMTPQQERQASVQLRKEFNALPDVKEFNDVANAYTTIDRLSKAPPTGASDISFIFSYMKMLDPGSVVREGEFATAANSGGIPDTVQNLYNKALDGKRLTPQQRQNFASTARNIYEGRKGRYDQIVSEYQGYATETGLKPDVIQPRIPAGSGSRAESLPATGRGAERGGMTEAQRRAVLKFRGATAAGGTDANPYAPTSEAEYRSLKPGAVYIHTDGTLRTKGRS